MSPPADRKRRVLAALDASRASLDALCAAAALAARLDAELEGLFVEDVNLLRAAGLPFASELSSLSGAARPLDRRAVERELRALADAARASLEKEARRASVGSSFRVARGQVSVELLTAAGDADLLVLGRTGRRAGRAPGETARAAAARAPTSVLLVGRGARLGRSVLVAYDGSPQADRALDLAVRLDGGAGNLTLLVAAAAPKDAERLLERARRRLATADAAKSLVVARRRDLARAASATGAVLLLGARTPAPGGDDPDEILDEIESPLLLVR